MTYLIFRPSRSEREERLRESRSGFRQGPIEGVVRCTEEAYEIERQRAKEGKPFARPYAVSGDSAEAKEAEFELMVRAGFAADAVERYQGQLDRGKRER